MRRFAPIVARQAGVRPFFYVGGGECGIWGSSCKRAYEITWGLALIGCVVVYRVAFCRYSTKRQFLGDVCDLYNNDDTQMEGDEATANLRIARERLMPFMNGASEAAKH